jgi:hypothetical protein
VLNRNLWQAYHRAAGECRWRWAGAGAFYSEAHAQALLKTSGGEILVIFGRQLPEDYEKRYRRLPR